MPYGPFRTREDYQQWLLKYAGQKDPQFYAIVNLESEQAQGVAAYLRVTPTSAPSKLGIFITRPPSAAPGSLPKRCGL